MKEMMRGFVSAAEIHFGLAKDRHGVSAKGRGKSFLSLLGKSLLKRGEPKKFRKTIERDQALFNHSSVSPHIRLYVLAPPQA
jgi:hypothetical protein